MEDITSAIKKEIPNSSPILGSYDEMEERWIKYPRAVLEVGQISQFVRNVIRDLKGLEGTFNVKKINFDLILESGRIQFDVQISEGLDKNE